MLRRRRRRRHPEREKPSKSPETERAAAATRNLPGMFSKVLPSGTAAAEKRPNCRVDPTRILPARLPPSEKTKR